MHEGKSRAFGGWRRRRRLHRFLLPGVFLMTPPNSHHTYTFFCRLTLSLAAGLCVCFSLCFAVAPLDLFRR